MDGILGELIFKEAWVVESQTRDAIGSIDCNFLSEAIPNYTCPDHKNSIFNGNLNFQYFHISDTSEM